MSDYSPYQPPKSPYGPSYHQPQYGHVLDESKRTQLMVCGIGLIAIGIIGAVGAAFMICGNILQIAAGQGPPPGEPPEYYVGYYGVLVIFALQMIVQPIVIWGGINMIRVRGRIMALTASVISVFPCISACCLLGMPFGIWGIILLNTEDVKRHMP